MKTFRATSGPFDQQYRFTTDEIDQACRDALVQEKLMPSQPEAIRIERFVEKRFNITVSYERLEPGILGCTLFNTNGSVKHVVISDQIDDGTKTGARRLYSTLAHEAGHGILHALLFMPSPEQGRMNLGAEDRRHLDFQQRRIMCRDTDVKEGAGKQRSYDGRWWEWQANRAIGGLLLPKRLVEMAVVDFLERSSVTEMPVLTSGDREAAVAHVGDIFDVNSVVAKIRLGEMYPDTGGQMSF
jgi:hypothetical protein